MDKNHVVNRYLLKQTGEGVLWWMSFIVRSIARNSRDVRGSGGLETTDCHLWLKALGNQVWQRVMPGMKRWEDENLVCAETVSLILSLWFCRTARAKAYDPRRRPADRRKVLRRLQHYYWLLIACATDESMDDDLFPEQDWDNPFSGQARYEPDETEKSRQKFYAGEKKRKLSD